MVYLVQGNAQELMEAFGQEWMLIENDDTCINPRLIEQELLQTPFFGTPEQARYFFKSWNAQVNGVYYLSGNMSASNLFCLTGMSRPFIKINETCDDYHENNVHVHFAYVNEAQELCGLMLKFQRNDPARWIMALMKNGHLVPSDRIITYLTSFDLEPYMVAGEQNIHVSIINFSQDFLQKQINSPLIYKYFKNIFIYNLGPINKHCERLTYLLRLLQGDKIEHGLIDPIDFSQINSQTFLEENFVLNKVNRYGLKLSFSLLKESLKPDNELVNEIKNIHFGDDETINKNLLQMVILFYEHQVLEKNREFIQNQLFTKTKKGFVWNDIQMNLLPYLLKYQLDIEFFYLVMTQKIYYNTIYILVQLGYDEDVPQLIADLGKRKQLEYIHGLKNIYTQKLCLIFWAKSKFTLKDYTGIVNATINYPLLAETLVAMDQKDVIPVKSLKRFTLKPEHHQLQSLLYHFGTELNRLGLKKADLKKLSIKELSDLNYSFSVLKDAGITDGTYYSLALKLNNDNHGQLLRLFLTSLDKMGNTKDRKELINILYIGLNQNAISQSKAIKCINDAHLRSLALSLHERFLCAKQMLDLNFDSDFIILAAEEWNVKGMRFRKIVLGVEEQCKVIHEKLRKSMVNKTKAQQWQNEDINYRKKLYQIAYDGLMKPGVLLDERIKELENDILNIVDPEIKSLFYNALIISANILILVLTISIANNIKEKRTGNYWFFNQTSIGEKIRALNKEVLNIINSPEPDPFLSP